MNDYIKRSDATSLLVSRLHETAQNNAGYQVCPVCGMSIWAETNIPVNMEAEND